MTIDIDIDPALDRVEIDGIQLCLDESARRQGLLVAFTNRAGGASAAPFDSLNLSTRVGDEVESVEANKTKLMGGLGLDRDSLVMARQVHGAHLIDADREISEDEEGDVLATRRSGVTLGVLTADCVPIIVLGSEGVAAIHAGWRGLVAGAVERGVSAVGTPIAAWVGPSIHACCYEVGPDVVDGFEARSLPIADAWHVDPGKAAFVALKRAGVEKVAASSDCTSCDGRYFSARRDKATGRQGGLTALL